jgi:hypothetical protein
MYDHMNVSYIYVEDRQLRRRQATPIMGKNKCLEALLTRKYGGNMLIDIILELDLSIDRSHSTLHDHDHLNYNKQ